MSALRGRRVVVTGAGHGIGAALARRFAQEGARVLVADLDGEAAAVVADGIGGHALGGDAASEEGIATLIARADDLWGGIDVWCANAGTDRGVGLDAPESDWALAWDVNVMAHVRAARALVPRWVESGGGRFVVTASAAGLLTMLGSPTYSVTKHGAVAFAEWLSATYQHRGISVHAICPQGVKTRMYEGMGDLKDVLDRGTVVTPEDVAEACVSAIGEDRFLVLPQPEVATFYQRRAVDTERWLRGMNRLSVELIDHEQ